MGLFDALLSQEGVNLTSGGLIGALDDKLMETRFDEAGNAYQADVTTPLHPGHTTESSLISNIPQPTPKIPTETIDLGRQQVVQPLIQETQPLPQSSFTSPFAQESLAQRQQATIAPWSPEQTDYTEARNVMDAYQSGERLAQRDSGTFQDLTPNADPSQAMEMLAMFKKEGKALTDLQFEKAMGSLGMSDILEEHRSQMDNIDESLADRDSFGNIIPDANAYEQGVDQALNRANRFQWDSSAKEANISRLGYDPMTEMHKVNRTTPNVIPESEPEPTFTPDPKATDFWNESAERDFNIKQNFGKAKEFGSDAIDTAGGILGPIAKSWYGNLTKDSERDVAEYNTDESLQGLMGQNVKRNIADMVKGGVDAAMNPVETADAIASLVSGTVQHALPDDMAWNEESKDMASAVADIYAERYGSLEGFKKALAENPAEVILELTGVGLVGKAGAAKLVSKLNNPDFLDKVESMSKAIDPTNLGPSSKIDDGVLGQVVKATDPMNFKTADEFIKASVFSEARDSTTRTKLRKLFDNIKEVESADILEPNPNNPKLDSDTVKIKEGLIEEGNRPYILVDGENVIDGHHALQAYRNLGYDEVPVVQKSKAIDSFYNNPTKADDGLLGQTKATDKIIELQSEIKRLKGLRGKDVTQRTIDELRWAEEDLLKLNPLVAHHNMSSEALKKHSEYGGDIAMPSLGISKPDAPFGVTRDTTFGEIALLGDNSLIDPKSSNTYSSDAYTGRSPREMVVFDKDVEKIKDALGADTLKFHNRALYDKGLDEPESLAINLKIQELLEARGYKPEDYPSFQSMKRKATEDLGIKEVSYITVEATRNPVELGEMKRLMLLDDGGKKEFSPKRALTEMRKQGGHQKGSEREISGSDFLHDSRARAITSEKYQSLDKLTSERNRVQNRSQYTHLEDEFSDMFDNTINDVEKVFKESFGDRMKPYKDGTKTYTSNLNRLDTLQVMQHVLLGEKIPDFMQLNTSDIVKIKQLVKPLEKMGREMPTAYFESKPNRIVNIGEFKTAIVPQGDTASIKRLEKLGIENIIEYKDQEGYLNAFKKNPELFFSKAIIPTGGLLGEDAISVEEEDEGEGLLSVKKKVEKPMNGVLDGIKKPKIVRNVRSNNPGNIKDFGIKWDGMTGTESGGTVAEGEFVVFDKPENGIRALTRDLTNKRKRGLDTITKILNKYAPNGKENDTKAYIKDVARDVGIGANDKLSDKNMFKMIKAITKHEGGKKSLKHFTDSIIKKGMKSAYKNKYQKFK